MIEILFFIFIGITIISISYYLFFLVNFSLIESKASSPKNIGVSVIICAKNEAENLKKFIPSILNQNYPDFEVVLINDYSSDSTLKVIKKFMALDERVKLVNVKPVEKFWGNKKYALTLGIKAATNDFLLFTDADCEPVSPNWINSMSSHFSSKKSIVLGYGAYKKVNGSLLNAMIRYETFLAAVQYFSFAKAGLPYMGVGRNLAYRKSLFLESSGFMKHIDIKSGDDDLFINQVATAENTEICISEESFTESIPNKTFSAWIRQKRRHISTAKYYKPVHKFLLSLFYFSQCLFWVTSTALLLLQFNYLIIIPIILVRVLVVLLVLYLASKKLKETGLIFLQPLLEIFLIIFQFFIFILNLTSKRRHWK